MTSTEKPRLVDAFCGGGGATRGYQLAGFHVTGVDNRPQPNYVGDEFIQADAVEFIREHGHEFDAIHASPPCQKFTAYRRRGAGVGESYPDLIAPVRKMLEASGRPWVMENVQGSPLRAAMTLCGSSFGLDVRRHRLFEFGGFDAGLTPPCAHGWQPRRFAPATNRSNRRRTVEVGVWRIPLAVQQHAMGIDWMDLAELSQAIPPAYTRFIGEQLLAHLGSVAA